MRKLIFISVFVLTAIAVKSQEYSYPMPVYTPTAENLKSRQEFQDMKFGFFLPWGISSVLGDGEWVMNNRQIPYGSYKRLADFFNPQQFNAKEWVQIAKAAGMKYITITTRHHDSFSMFKTAASPYNIVDATAYGKDPMKELAAECKKEGVRLNFYYSLLDWAREDYGYNKKIVNGAPENTNWDSYIAFMKAQLTELLTNYGEIGAIWFDGHWQRKTANWHYDEIYSLIHKLSPKTMVGNNHHLMPIAGEDFQMFERDLPGENKGGFSHGVKVSQLPLESCETMNNTWGFNINDRSYKTTKQVVHYLVNAAGRDANLLLNVGPMPNGKIQQEFADTLKKVGVWTSKHGESIYGTRGKVIPPQEWGMITQKGKVLYVHILNQTGRAYIFIPGLNLKVIAANSFDGNLKIKFKQVEEGVFVYTNEIPNDPFDQIVKLTIR
jgi:alpha-L-fucosidase